MYGAGTTTVLLCLQTMTVTIAMNTIAHSNDANSTIAAARVNRVRELCAPDELVVGEPVEPDVLVVGVPVELDESVSG